MVEGIKIVCHFSVVLIVSSAVCHAAAPLGENFPPGGLPPHDLSKASSLAEPSLKWRMPETLKPVSYIIHLRPIFDDSTIPADDPHPWTVVGTVEINLECLEPTNEIILHALELQEITVDNVEVWNLNTETPITVNVVANHEDESAEATIFTLNEELIVGQTYVIKISNYRALIADNKGFGGRMNGLYRTTYVQDNEGQTVAVTHFSRTRGFRKLVPSFDEPKFKANFTISLGRHSTYSTLCNMNRNAEEAMGPDFPEWFWDHYDMTPIMPPTVLAMVIHKDLHEQTAQAPELNKDIGVWGPRDIIAGGQAVFSAEAVASLLTYYNDYFEIDYELPKMDSVGVNHFGAGAMENWGLNIYRSSYMFLNLEFATAAQNFATASVISHELAHQWWGNLVTHQWWNDWWLTEGFATYFQYEMFGDAYPTYEPKVRAVTDELQVALAFDITAASTPIHGTFENEFGTNPSQIDYSKGSALVRMMRGFLTEPVFRRAVISYLNNRSYTAVQQDELFDDLQVSLEAEGETPENGVSMNAIMADWTTTVGFPLVRVSKALAANTVYFSQERFKEESRPVPDQFWYIPITYATKSKSYSTNFGDRKPDLWLNRDVSLLSHTIENSNDWILVNPDARAYYRVLYDDHFASLLQIELNNNLDVISEASRSQLIDDYLSAAFELYVRFDEVDKMTSFIDRETRLGSWISYLRHFRKAYNLLRLAQPDTDFIRLKDYILPKVQRSLQQIGIVPPPEEDESIQTTILRSQLLDWSCGMTDQPCIDYALQVFSEWMSTPESNPIRKEVRSVVYCTAASSDADGRIWDFLRAQFYATDGGDPALRSALRCSTDQPRLDALLSEAMGSDDGPIPPVADAWALLTALAGSTIPSRANVVDALTRNLQTLVDTVQIEGIVDVFNAMVPLVSEPEEIVRIQAIIDGNLPHFTPDVAGRLNSAVAAMNANTEWLPKFTDRFLVNF